MNNLLAFLKRWFTLPPMMQDFEEPWSEAVPIQKVVNVEVRKNMFRKTRVHKRKKNALS